MIAESIFNSRIRYGIAVYLTPTFDEEDLKVQKLSKNTTILQKLQNTMLRIIMGLDLKQHVNMKHVREKIKMMSVNQMCVYHTIIEAYNIVKYSSSNQIKMMWEDKLKNTYSLRSESTNSLKIPEKPSKKCIGFTYCGAKLFNQLPKSIKESPNQSTFKFQLRKWIWEKIPSH